MRCRRALNQSVTNSDSYALLKNMEVDYSARVAAFIDILGFTSLVSRLKKDQELHTKVFNALRTIGSYKRLAGDTQFAQKNLEVSVFSDSIVISAKPDHLLDVVWACLGLQSQLLSLGVLLRGGISSGELIHKDDILYGEGMLKAYHLESGAAIYPRIIVDPELEATILPQPRAMLLTQDHDGIWYIDQFADGILPPDVDRLIEDGYDPNEVALNELKDFLDQELSVAKTVNVRMKLNWLQSRRNEAAEYLQLNGKPKIFHLRELSNPLPDYRGDG